MIKLIPSVEPHHIEHRLGSHMCRSCEGDGRFELRGCGNEKVCGDCSGHGACVLTCADCDTVAFPGPAVVIGERVLCATCARDRLVPQGVTWAEHADVVANVVQTFARLRAERAYKDAAE